MSTSVEPNGLTEEHKTQIENITRHTQIAADLLDNLIKNATSDLVHLAVAITRDSVLIACPEATSATWQWCGDGDSPTTLGQPLITCPHALDSDGCSDLETFEGLHGTGTRLANSLVGHHFEESEFMVLARRGSTAGFLNAAFTKTDGWVFTLDLTQP